MNSVLHNDLWHSRWCSWLSRSRLLFFFAAYFFAQAAIFIFLVSKSGMLDRTERIRGKDFLIFYMIGYVVQSGHADRLYDQGYINTIQRSLVEKTDLVVLYPNVYPPQTALLFAPLGALPYGQAVIIWWCIQLLCFGATGYLLYDQLRPPPGWRLIACLGFASFYPIWSTISNGQLAALLILVMAGGLRLRQQSRLMLAGLLLSLVAIKPQFGVGLCIWFLLRQEWRTLLGLFLGGLLQIAITGLLLGFDVFLSYLQSFQVLGHWYVVYYWPPDHLHALAGNLRYFLNASQGHWATIIQVFFDLLVGLFLFQITRRSAARSNLDMAAGFTFTLFILPYFLTYDLTYLLIPIASLLSLARTDIRYLTPAVLLYGSSTLAPLYAFLGVSLVPVALFVVLWQLKKLAVSAVDLAPVKDEADC